MKRIIILALLSIPAFNAFSQSISLADLIAVYDAPHEEINKFLTKEKKYKPFIEATRPQFTVYHYFLNRGKENEEEVITGMGFEITPGKINTDLYYKSRDSSFVGNLQSQAIGIGLNPQKETSSKTLRTFEYANEQIVVKFTYSSMKNYMIYFNRKRKELIQ